MKEGLKRNREPEGWMNTEELHVKWWAKPPLAGLGPFGMGKAKASTQSEGIRELQTGGSLHE